MKSHKHEELSFNDKLRSRAARALIVLTPFAVEAAPAMAAAPQGHEVAASAEMSPSAYVNGVNHQLNQLRDKLEHASGVTKLPAGTKAMPEEYFFRIAASPEQPGRYDWMILHTVGKDSVFSFDIKIGVPYKKFSTEAMAKIAASSDHIPEMGFLAVDSLGKYDSTSLGVASFNIAHARDAGFADILTDYAKQPAAVAHTVNQVFSSANHLLSEPST